MTLLLAILFTSSDGNRMVEHLVYIAKMHTFDAHPLNTNITKPSAEIIVFCRGFSLSVVELFAFHFLGYRAEAPGCSLFCIKLFSCFFAQFLPWNELIHAFSPLFLTFHCIKMPLPFGRGDGPYWTRTSDPRDVNTMLYQLSQRTLSLPILYFSFCCAMWPCC